MAVIIIQRLEKQNSMFVDFNITLNGNNEGTISNNSIVSLEDIPIGVHEVYVSNLKGLYRSKKIKITIKDKDEKKYLETGPNTSIEHVFPLSVFAMGLITIRSYYIKEIENLLSENKIDKRQEEDFFYLNNPWNIFLLLIPASYILINKIGFPEYFQFIGNVIMLIGSVFTLFIRYFKSNISNLFHIKVTYFLGYTILMTVITSENNFLFLFNLFILLFIVTKYLLKYLKYPN